MKQTGMKPAVETSLNLTSFSIFEQGIDYFQPDSIRNGSIFHLDETDISLLNALNANPKAKPPFDKPEPPAPRFEISNTLKEIDDLLIRLKPARENSQPNQNPVNDQATRKNANNGNYNSGDYYSQRNHEYTANPQPLNTFSRPGMHSNDTNTTNVPYVPIVLRNKAPENHPPINQTKDYPARPANFEPQRERTNERTNLYTPNPNYNNLNTHVLENNQRNQFVHKENSQAQNLPPPLKPINIIPNPQLWSPSYDNRSTKGAAVQKKGVNYWDIPFVGNDSSFNSTDRKTSNIEGWGGNEKDLEVFVLEKNVKLKQITKSLFNILNSTDTKVKSPFKVKVFNPIYKYYLSVISNDGNSIGLYCDVRQIEKFLNDFLEILANETFDSLTVKLWLLSLRGLLISKEKHNKIKSNIKVAGNENLSITSFSVTYVNEMESIENIESEDEFSDEE